MVLVDDIYLGIMLVMGLGTALMVTITLLFVIMHFVVYNIKVRVRELINGRVVIQDTRARQVRNRQGEMFLKIKKYAKDKAPIPPHESVDITKKGKRVVECYRMETGEYLYLSDNPRIREIPKEILGIKDKDKKKQAIKDWKKENNIQVDFKPFTSAQRAIMANEIQKAELRKFNNWTHHLPTIVSIGGLLLMFILLIFNWQEITKPYLDSRKIEAGIATSMATMSDNIVELKNEVQKIDGENEDNKPPD